MTFYYLISITQLTKMMWRWATFHYHWIYFFSDPCETACQYWDDTIRWRDDTIVVCNRSCTHKSVRSTRTSLIPVWEKSRWKDHVGMMGKNPIFYHHSKKSFRNRQDFGSRFPSIIKTSLNQIRDHAMSHRIERIESQFQTTRDELLTRFTWETFRVKKVDTWVQIL